MDALKITAGMNALLRQAGSPQRNVSLDATEKLVTALAEALRPGIMAGDIVTDIFGMVDIAQSNNSTHEVPLDLLAPGTESNYTAYTIPNHGRLADHMVEGDYVQIPIYSVGNAINWLLRYAEDARWDIIERSLQIMKLGFTKKINDDGWHVLLGAAADRNILVFDADAEQGQFTKRLVSLLTTTMRRNGGGNSTSINRKKLTDLWISPEGQEDMRNWGVDQLDDISRREIYTAADGQLNEIFRKRIHDIDEFGVGAEYQLFLTQTLGAALAASGTGHAADDVELVIGMDLSDKFPFQMPVRETLQIFPDDSLHREQRGGAYGWTRFGLGQLDNRCIIAGSY